jgi:hypothetical protein
MIDGRHGSISCVHQILALAIVSRQGTSKETRQKYMKSYTLMAPPAIPCGRNSRALSDEDCSLSLEITEVMRQALVTCHKEVTDGTAYDEESASRFN